MDTVRGFLMRHRPVAVLAGIVLALTAVPVLETAFVVGDAWQGILPPFSDGLYLARVHTIAEGHFTAGNPYYLEHSDGPPLVIFGGAWLNAIPFLAGIPLFPATMVNFILWSLLFAAAAYWLLRELRVPPWIAVFGTVFLYVQSYEHVWRPVNLQTVYPFFFLFYVALLRLMREQNRKNVTFLALATGATFYIYSYLWQIAVITLGLLVLYALIRRAWPLAKAAVLASVIGGAIGLPIPLYMLWLSRASPYFWESIYRLGLVDTHLPMAEVIYSGGWIGLVLALLAVLFWRMRALRESAGFWLFASFLAVSGLGLWIMEGSNLITGKLLETGEHMPGFIFPWLAYAAISIGVFLWSERARLSDGLRLISAGMLLLLAIASIRFVSLDAFMPPYVNRATWQRAQGYARPLAWLQSNEKDPVVVWSDPHDTFLTTFLPIYTRHFTLDVYWGMLELVPEGEIRERYLISQYFNNPTVADLRGTNELELYLGRRDSAHQAKTIERGIKICRILFFWDKGKDCGTPPTPQELLGDAFFAGLEQRFQNDIRPNIRAYLKKYHVAYILKDRALNPAYRPETLGAVQVYADDRFELYRMRY